MLTGDVSLLELSYVSSDTTPEGLCQWADESIAGRFAIASDTSWVAFSGEGERTAPGRLFVAITRIQPDGDNQLIVYEAVASDSAAQVSLYYAVDNDGSGGCQIVQGLSGSDGSHSYTWDTANVPDGDYFVYAVIEDGVHEPHIAHAPAMVSIRHPGIQGRIWLDENGNSAWDADEHAIAGVPVYLDLNCDGAYQVDEPRAVSQSRDPAAETDNTGLYAFSGLLRRDYVIRQLPPEGFVQSYPADNASHNVTIADASVVAGIDFAIRVTPGNITGITWNDDNRNGIRNEGETTVSSVAVQLLDEHFEVVTTTCSDRSGHYEFADLVPGEYSVFFQRRELLGFTLQDVLGTDDCDSDVDPLSGMTGKVHVASGAVVGNLDAGLFSEFQNATNKLDVNDDDRVSAVDVLIIINWLTSHAGTVPPDAPPYRDVTGDGYVSPIDALRVMNYLTAADPPGDTPDSPDVPVLLSPPPGAIVSTATVTLRFQPLTGYTGNYLVRLDDLRWDGRQASGFQHDSTAHYLSLSTKLTSVTVAVRAGHTYRWWVHKPGFDAALASFTVDGIDLSSIADPPPAEQVFPPELIDGRYCALAMQQWSNRQIDVSGVLQQWINQLPTGATLELPAGKYLVNNQIAINQRITLTSVGKSLGDPACDPSAGDCAQLIATPGLNQPFGILLITQLEALHHIVVDGNRQGRQGTFAYQRVASADNRYGFNAMLMCDNCIIEGSVFQNALGGTGLAVVGTRFNLAIRRNLFAHNGVHTIRNLWADGLTVLDMRDSSVEDNNFLDNTDIDLIFGGARNSIIRGNHIVHTSNRAGGSFAGLMIHKWPTTSGDYTGVDVSGNIIDGGPNREIGSGIYLASEGWYDQTPFGSLAAGQVSAVHHNIVRNTKNGMYIAASRFRVYANEYSNTHGVAFRSSRGTLTSPAPVVVSPRATSIDFVGENTNPATRHLFASQDWRGCIPNWPF